jgi:divalent metal cation (Fe/Co/Zn/Cd) transporter
LVYGLQNCVDFLSSVVVLWRFYCPGEMTKEREELLQKRETRASMAISFVFILLGFAVIGAAATELVRGEEANKDMTSVMVIALSSVFIFGALAVIKLHYANKLNSPSLQKDGVCSLIGTVLSVGLFATTFIIEKAPSNWWLDPAFATACGLVSLLLGLHAVIVASCVEKIPIFSIKWWAVSQGDGMDEMAGTELESTDFGEEGDQTEDEKEDTTKLSELV